MTVLNKRRIALSGALIAAFIVVLLVMDLVVDSYKCNRPREVILVLEDRSQSEDGLHTRQEHATIRQLQGERLFGDEMILNENHKEPPHIETIHNANRKELPIIRNENQRNLQQTAGKLQETTYYSAAAASVPALDTTHHTCRDPLCFEYLNEEDRMRWDWCINKTESSLKHWSIRNGTCKFMNGTGRNVPGPVALTSHPGSGNTWLRCLLEVATGICTGAVYCDGTLRTNNYTGEGIKSSNVIAVKTHTIRPHFVGELVTTAPVFASAIVLVRNPRDAMVADWHRRRNNKRTNSTVSNHVLSVGAEMFGENKMWKESVPVMISRWQQHVTSWLVQGMKHPLLVVQFEDVKADPAREVGKMLKFLGQPFNDQELRMRMNGACQGFKRPQHDDFDHYTQEQRDLIHQAVTDTLQSLQEAGTKEGAFIAEYLHTGAV